MSFPHALARGDLSAIVAAYGRGQMCVDAWRNRSDALRSFCFDCINQDGARKELPFPFQNPEVRFFTGVPDV